MQYTFNDEEIERQVLDFMASINASPAAYEKLVFDGSLHRYDIDGEKRGRKSGAYIIHTDGFPAGFIQNWKIGVKEKWKFDTTGLPEEQRQYFNSEEYRRQEEEREKRQQEREQKRKEKQIEAAEYSRIFWETLKEASENHEYLQKKHIKPLGVRTNGLQLAIPLRNIQGIVKSIQWIDIDGKKRFQPNTAIDGLFWSVGLENIPIDVENTILLGEGFATMAKIHELIGLPCVAGISCHFMKAVAKLLHEKYSKSKIYVMADNDKATELKRGFNPGVYHARELVKDKIAHGVIVPEFDNPEDGTDWDDFALKFGDEECKRVLTEKLEEIPLKERQEFYRQKAEEYGLVSYEMFDTFCKPAENPAWLIEDWLPAESLVMLFAASGSGKSFVTNSLAYAIANPNISHWHGKRVLTHGSVVYIAGEGQRGMRKRLAGLVDYVGVNTSGVKMAVIKEPVMIDDKDVNVGINRTIANIGRIYPNPSLVVFDTLTASMIGDENKTSDASTFIRFCNLIIQEFGCTVLLVHHTGHNIETQGRARGSSVFKAAMDLEIKAELNGHILTLSMTKSKDTEIQPSMRFDMKSIEVAGFYKSTGEPDTTCVLELNEEIELSDVPQVQKKLTPNQKLAMDSFQKAVQEYGVLLQCEIEGETCEAVGVKLEDWRKMLYKMSYSDKESTQRSYFNRAQRFMFNEQQILFEYEKDKTKYYCLKPTGDAYEATLRLELRHKQEESE